MSENDYKCRLARCVVVLFSSGRYKYHGMMIMKIVGYAPLVLGDTLDFQHFLRVRHLVYLGLNTT